MSEASEPGAEQTVAPGMTTGALDEVEYTLELGDLVRFCRHLARSEPRIQRRLLIGYPIAWAAALLVSYCQGLEHWHLRGEAFTFGFAASVIVVSLAYPVFLWLYPILLARRLADRPGFLGRHLVEISEQGVVNQTSVVEGRYDWPRVQAEAAPSGDLYLKLQRFYTLIIPSRAFAASGQREQWVQWIEARRAAALESPDQDPRPALEAVPVADDAIVVRFTLRPDDLWALVRHDYLHNGLLTSILSILALGLLGAFALNGGMLGGALGTIGGVLLHSALLPRLRFARWSARLTGEHVLVFEPKGIVGWVEEVGGGILTWAGVSRLDVTGEHLFVYYCPGAVVVPLSAFGKRDERDLAITSIRAWLADAATRPPAEPE